MQIIFLSLEVFNKFGSKFADTANIKDSFCHILFVFNLLICQTDESTFEKIKKNEKKLIFDVSLNLVFLVPVMRANSNKIRVATLQLYIVEVIFIYKSFMALETSCA